VNSRCEDYVNCTTNECVVGVGCVFTPNNASCSDGITCTEDICNPELRNCGQDPCVHIPVNTVCNDGISCTVDTCDPVQGCMNQPDNDLCSDGIGCTVDQCIPSLGPANSCVHTTDDSLCDDGFTCSNKTCVANQGCIYDYSQCPWISPAYICIECMSTGSRITQVCYSDGTGALQLQTRQTPYPTTPVNDGSGLITNVLMTPYGAVVIGANSQSDVLLHRLDALVVNGHFRLLPLPFDQLPTCNFVLRGMMAVVEKPLPCPQNSSLTCTFDTIYICLQEQSFIWKQLN